LGKSQTIRREGVEIGRGNFSAVTTGVRVTHVVGHDYQYVWLFGPTVCAKRQTAKSEG
jgi:hypothetical protein